MKSKTLLTVIISALLTVGNYAVAQSQKGSEKDEKKQEQQSKPEKKKSKVGSFLRKVGESTTGINMSNEAFVAMNLDAQKLIDMEVMSCVRDSATNMVVLALGVKAKQDGVKTDLGKSCGNGNQDCVTAYDTKGNTYEGQEIGKYSEINGQKENPAGIPVKYEFAFAGIPPTLSSIEVVQVEFYIYASQGSVGSNMSKVEPIQVRNVAIQ